MQMDGDVKKVVASRIKIARIFFIISALYGLTLRLFHIVDIPIKYKNILHAHSHVTFLGWGFLAVVSIVGLLYYPKRILNSVYLKRLFLIMTITLFGMLVSFPIQGYKLFSIIFLSVFLITSYFYVFDILKQLRSNKEWSAKFIRTSVYYYYLSSIAIWAVAIISVKIGKTDLYHNTVYFYLHFLYNGFFVFALFGLLVKFIETQKIKINKKYIFNFYWLTNIAVVPAYILSLLWIEILNYLYIIAIIAALLQMVSLKYLFKMITVILDHINTKHIKQIFYFVMVSYFLKISLQLLSIYPEFFNIALKFKSYFIIGYLHLFTLGFMSMFIILLLKIHPKKNLSKLGINTLMIGIFFSELLLFINGFLLIYGLSIPNINILLFIVSSLMPLGLLIIHFKLVIKK